MGYSNQRLVLPPFPYGWWRTRAMRRMPSVNGYGKGDLYVKILVWIPHKLSRSEKEAIEEMRNSSSFKPDPTRDDRALFEKESKYF